MFERRIFKSERIKIVCSLHVLLRFFLTCGTPFQCDGDIAFRFNCNLRIASFFELQGIFVLVTCPAVDPEIPIYSADDTYCGVFYECSDGLAWKFDCAPGTYYDIERNLCSYDVDCGNRRRSTYVPTSSTKAPK